MRNVLKTGVGAAVLLGACLTAGAAFAGADDGGTKAFFENPNPPVSAPITNSRQARYTATYSAQQQEQAAAAKDPEYFYHAMGTMGAQ